MEKTEEANNDVMKQRMGNFMIREKGELSLDCWRRSLMLRMKSRIHGLAIFFDPDRIASNKIEFNAKVASWIQEECEQEVDVSVNNNDSEINSPPPKRSESFFGRHIQLFSDERGVEEERVCNAFIEMKAYCKVKCIDPDAQKLLVADQDQEKIFNIFTQHNIYQLRAIFYEYDKISNIKIEKLIENTFSGDDEHAFLTLILIVKNQASYFAGRLSQALSGLGTDDFLLIRIIVTRAEKDLLDIRREYFRMYSSALEDDVSKDTSGAYMKCMRYFIRGNY